MPSLGKDLATIRSQQGLSIEDVQQATKIPPHTLRSIEDDSIFEDIDKNTTYIRSYVRSYSKAIGVSEQDIVRALDQVEAGNYDGHLAETTNISSDSTEDASPGETTDNNDMVHDHSPEFDPDKKGKSPSPKKPKRRKSALSSGTLSSVDWVDVGRKANPEKSRSRVWSAVLIIVVVVAALAAAFLLYGYYNDEPASEPSQQQNNETIQPQSPSDSLRESLITEDNEPPRSDTVPVDEQGTLSDTLSISIYAANGKLEPVRIYTDILGEQNPYWVPQGDTISFNFVNTVHVQAINQYDRLQLLFNGHLIQNYFQQYYNSETGMVELDRSVFENHPEWR